MNEKELLEYMTPAQVDYLGKFMDGCNKQHVECQGGTRKNYTVNDYSLSDVLIPVDSAENTAYFAIIRPDDHLNEVGLLSIMMVERSGDTWYHAPAINGKLVVTQFESDKIMLLFPYKRQWPQDKWILLPKEEPCDAPAG